NTVDASQPDEGAETAAARFISWLAHTRRPWALVIDDLAELSDLEELWPSGASGRVLITTRLPAHAFEAAPAEAPASERPASEGPASEGPASEGPASEGPASEGWAIEGMDLRVVPVRGL